MTISYEDRQLEAQRKGREWARLVTDVAQAIRLESTRISENDDAFIPWAQLGGSDRFKWERTAYIVIPMVMDYARRASDQD